MKGLLIILYLISIFKATAQQKTEEGLQPILKQNKGDKAEVDALVRLGRYHEQPDSAFWYAREALSKAKKVGYQKGEADCFMVLEKVYARQGNFSKAVQAILNALTIYEKMNNYVGIAAAHGMLQAIYRETGDYQRALSHAFKSLHVAERHNVKGELIFPGHRWATLMLAEIGQTYILMNRLDSALVYTMRAIGQNELFNGTTWEFPIYLQATILTKKGNYKPAHEKYREALALCVPNGIPWDKLQVYSGMSTLFLKTMQDDSAVHYAQIVIKEWTQASEYKNLLEAVSNLAQVYKNKGNLDSALRYTELSYAIKDSIFSAEKEREVQSIAFDAKLKEEEWKAAQIHYKSRMQLYVFIAGSIVLLFILTLLWRSNQHKIKAKARVERAYEELKSTQAQLVQREKMASLGELTAGIAHEIQNPLNFVNNFSQANQELLEELQVEAQRGNLQEVVAIASDLKANEEKISHHGQRADRIVKGMLQHARTSTGSKEPTDINHLVDEYLRLSYQGTRARDNGFSATIETHFDDAIGKINVVPEEMGRVLLNLFNNAFYAIREKKKQLNGIYEPVVCVTTKREDNHVSIAIKDNGTGMPQQVAEKVFQPFFTTKPTGEGTGLGLSLSYDIIIKGHGGMLQVQSKEGEGAEFVIELPVIAV